MTAFRNPRRLFAHNMHIVGFSLAFSRTPLLNSNNTASADTPHRGQCASASAPRSSEAPLRCVAVCAVRAVLTRCGALARVFSFGGPRPGARRPGARAWAWCEFGVIGWLWGRGAIMDLRVKFATRNYPARTAARRGPAGRAGAFQYVSGGGEIGESNSSLRRGRRKTAVCEGRRQIERGGIRFCLTKPGQTRGSRHAPRVSARLPHEVGGVQGGFGGTGATMLLFGGSTS